MSADFRVGIVATANTNPYATTMAARLMSQGLGPHCIILASESAARRALAYARVAGVRAMLGKIVQHYRPGALPDPNARSYLRDYAARHDLADWDTPLSILAAKNRIALARVASLHDEQAVACVRDHRLDLLINAAGVIFKPPLLEAPRIGMLNAHMGRLPEFRGMNVLEWSLWFGQPPGITIHFVTPGIDLGDILEFRPIPVGADDTVASLRAKSYAIMVEAMVDAVASLRDGRAVRTPQTREHGRQYFVMHPRLLAIVEQRLRAMKSRAT
ncbi:MAG TPA: formyltransferase family protein [Phycisphaerae bacterium]|nr:formyltransferase family protein [Phycisphaerae bacterium]HOM50773.1 formyltransferase family protein [Phycisphaerae bacterium]HON65149.1 formyltransferase family protein [Phycisphaerae bacterium]HOQ85826.1 formyltransferase family protein [Phycisphaerae bacterium]HPP26052.1 formyltransferase family protein [Phycisphaerae bacterium]